MIRMKSAIGVLISLAVLGGPVVAQMPDPYVRDTVPVRGLMPYADQISSPIDNIDPVSGKVSLSIPLASIPAGRGGLGFDLALTYDSHIYDLYPYQVPGYDPNDGHALTAIYSRIGASQTGGGWHYNFKNIRVWLEEKANHDLPDPNNPNYCRYDKVVAWRLRVGLPDGSNHILHLRPAEGESGSQYRTDGFAGVMPSGMVRPEFGNAGEYGWQPRTGKLIYYTNDGSYLKYETNTSEGSTLYFPDGRRAKVGWEAGTVYDANRNKISIQNLTSAAGYSCSTSRPCTKLVDDTGNHIMIEYNVETNGTMTRDRITAPGPDGDMVWTVDWDLAGPGNKNYMPGSGSPYFPDPTLPLISEARAVRYVQMPLADPIALDQIAAHKANPLGVDDPVPVYNSYKFAYSDYFDIGAGELDYIRTPSGSEYFYKYRYQGPSLVWPADMFVFKNTLVEREVAFNDGVDGNNNHICPV